ncbi:MAG: hypothetical protein H7099_19545 [Gemmatimonadaceae bacterium]|nr:hypothetical protein [Gemmatimonadaceae bacterium]
MSMPNVVHPWSFTPSTLTEAPPESASTDVAPIAAALFAAGLVNSAIALATPSTNPELQLLASEWQQTVALDDAVAALIARGSGPLIPSVSARPDGSPRFVIQVTDASLATRAIAQEHADDGVSAELRLFLDDALRDGDRFVDAAPADGFAALSAATCGRAVSVIALCDSARQRVSLETSADWSEVADAITAVEADTLHDLSFAPSTAGATTLLHAGGAAAVASLLTGARAALERRDIGAVAWRCGRADETSRDAESLQIAAAVLGVFGFQHFALSQGDRGMELVPADAMASNEMIFSLEPSFLMRFTA